MPEYVYETLKKVERIESTLLSNNSTYNQAFENLMILHNALAENIAKHIKMTDNVASTAGEMFKTAGEMYKTVKELGNGFKEMRLTLSEFGKNYRLFLIGQILLYGLIALLILKEVIS